jgi:hypothetical protein
MAMLPGSGKLYPLFTSRRHLLDPAGMYPAWEGKTMLVGIAIAMFIALFGWGATYFGWSDPEGKVQLALFTCFILGATCGYKSRG